MPSAAELSNTIGSIFSNMFQSSSQKYLIYVGWFLWAFIILGTGFLVYFWIKYKYKFYYVEGSIEDDNGDKTKQIIKILKVKKDRAMPISDKGIDRWRLLFLFNKKIEPFDNKYILPGNNVFAFRTGKDTFNPIEFTAGNPSANFSVDPFDRAFLNLGVQSDAREYMKDNDLRRTMIWAGVIGILCLIAMVVAGWLILKYSAGTAAEIKTAGNILKGVTEAVVPK